MKENLLSSIFDVNMSNCENVQMWFECDALFFILLIDHIVHGLHGPEVQ